MSAVPASRAARVWAIVFGCICATSFAFVSSTASAVTPPSGEVYVANNNAGTVSQYGTDATGTASALPYPTAPAGPKVSHLIVSPNGKYAYAVDCLDGVIDQYAVDTSGLLEGALVPMTPPSVEVGGCDDEFGFQPAAHTLVENKAGKFVFLTGVFGNGDEDITTLAVGKTGQLAQSSGTEEFLDDPSSIAVTPNGKFLFVASVTGLLFEYAVDSHGTLTFLDDRDQAGSCLSDLAVSPNGKFLYTTDRCLNTVSMYSISSTGLTMLLQFVSTSCPSAIVIAPDGKAAYITNSCLSDVSQFSVATTGQLTALSPARWSVGSNPLDLAIAPSGKSLYVANSGSNTVSAFTVGKTQLLTPMTGRPLFAAGSGAWGIAVRK